MSIDHVSKVLNLGPEVTGTNRLVLLVLAEAANQKDDECWPGLATIRDRAGLRQDKYVRKAIEFLVDQGLVEVDPNGCPDMRIRADRRPNLYRMVGAMAVSNGGARRAAAGGRDAPDVPHMEPEVEPEAEPLAAGAAEGAEDPARDLVSAFFEWCSANGKPRPTLRVVGGKGPDRAFVALVGIVRTLLDAGHEPKAIKVALTQTKAYTIDSITFALNEGRPRAAQGLGPGSNRIQDAWADAGPSRRIR